MAEQFSHTMGFDDAPFPKDHQGDVLIIGTVFSGLRLEGVLSAKVRRDGMDSTDTLLRLISESRFAPQVQVVLLQGIAFAGFNVIDINSLHHNLGIPIVVVCRKQPNFKAIKNALLNNVPDGHRKWSLIESLGAMQPADKVFVQHVGVSLQDVDLLIRQLAVNSSLPEPLRTAHIIAGGIGLGESRHRA
jgi:endonuclease V-like protein UPF0215 family